MTPFGTHLKMEDVFSSQIFVVIAIMLQIWDALIRLRDVLLLVLVGLKRRLLVMIRRRGIRMDMCFVSNAKVVNTKNH